MSPERRFGAPDPGVSHFHDEAMVVHARTCDLVTKRSTRCTCQDGPNSGYEDVPMEGPRLEFKTFDDQLSADRAAALRAENDELREKLRQLTGGSGGSGSPRPGVASATAEVPQPAGPGLKVGRFARGR